MDDAERARIEAEKKLHDEAIRRYIEHVRSHRTTTFDEKWRALVAPLV